MLHLSLAVAMGLLFGPGDESKKAVEDFKTKMKDARSLQEKALAIRALGDVDPRDACTAAAIAKYLAPTGGDLCYLLPVTAADALGKYRGCAAASKVLLAALPSYKKIPYVYARIHAAIGRVGHESALALFEGALQGTDADAAASAVRSIADFPAALAFDTLFRQAEAMEKKRGSAGDDQKKVMDRVQAEIIKVVQGLSGEKYPTIKELATWWQKHGGSFKEESAKRDRTPAGPSTGPLPPALLVELLFKENMGQTTVNSGASGGAYPQAAVTGAKWTGTAALNGGPAALEWDRGGSTSAVDLGGGAGLEPLKQLKSFTITGWLLCQDAHEGPAGKDAGAGNRILSWLAPGKNGDGVELVWRGDGSLQLGVNQPADASPARTGSNKVPVQDMKAKDPGTASLNAWRFFAVTYDAGIASGHVKFYVGEWQKDVALVSAHDLNRGAAGPKIAPTLTIGNVSSILRPMAPDRAFRGVIDEIRVFGSTSDGTGALNLQELLKVQNRQPGT